MADVFISYHEKSAGELVAQIAEELESAGISCWYAKRDIPFGGDFACYVPPQIDACKVFLLILNENAQNSRHIESELRLAFIRLKKGENITLLPLEIGDFKQETWVKYYLTRTQSVKMPTLDGIHIRQLIRRISRLLDSQRSIPSEEPLLKVSLQKKSRDVFISYHRNSAFKLTKRICTALEQEGISCWYAPRDVTLGIPYMASIMNAIRECRIFLLILNRGANESKDVFSEVYAAFHQNKGFGIVPFRIENVALRDEFIYMLGPLHYIDSDHSPPMESDIQNLVNRIAGALGKD